MLVPSRLEGAAETFRFARQKLVDIRPPAITAGAWVFKGTRTPVAVVFENLEDGMTIDEMLEQFPVTREQVMAVLEFAARSLDAPAAHR